ncbi:MAG: GNAT family N-acetyltransferase [Hyphomicrobiales bacterium]
MLKSSEPYIRMARSTDANALASCIEAAYAKYEERIADLPNVSEGIADEIANKQVWVALESGEIVASLFLAANDGFLKLENLAVHPNHSGKGLGRRLTELAENEARLQGYEELRLNTHLEIPENIKLYEHLGWEKISQNGKSVSMRKIPIN